MQLLAMHRNVTDIIPSPFSSYASSLQKSMLNKEEPQKIKILKSRLNFNEKKVDNFRL